MKWLRILGLISTILILSFVIFKKAIKDSNKVIHVQLGTNNLFIPRLYFDDPFIIEKTAIRLIVKNTHFEPFTTPQKDFRNNPEKIRIMVELHPKKLGMDDTAKNMVNSLKASSFVEAKYGLVHQKQPEDEVQDFRDIWLDEENGKYVSLITCSDKLSDVSVPQCTQYLDYKNLRIENSFDKKLLPQWKAIKNRTLALFTDFETEASAKKLLEHVREE